MTRIINQLNFLSGRCLSCLPKYFSTSQSPAWTSNAIRIPEPNPINHNFEHIGMFYTVPEESWKTLFAYGGFPKSFKMNIDTFNEASIMIRKPAIEIIDFMKKTDFNRPVVRYLLYGKPGCGKSLSLAHVLHYAYENEFLVLHVPWVWNWFRSSRIEVAYSTVYPGWVNLPLISANWLKVFKTQNETLLQKLNIMTSKEYVWSPRESTPSGCPILDLVDHGINRAKYAADCIIALIYEIKAASSAKMCKTFVAIDGFNALFGDFAHMKTEDKTFVLPTKTTLAKAFLEATKQDWTNGAVVVTVDQLAAVYKSKDCHFPLYLLGKDGFEHLSPFVALHVPELSDLEFQNMMNYYEEKKWVQRKDGRQELSFLSNNNPYTLMNLCASI